MIIGQYYDANEYKFYIPTGTIHVYGIRYLACHLLQPVRLGALPLRQRARTLKWLESSWQGPRICALYTVQIKIDHASVEEIMAKRCRVLFEGFVTTE